MHGTYLNIVELPDATDPACTAVSLSIWPAAKRLSVRLPHLLQIICEGVDYTSSTFDPFLDLSLEINKANSLSRALQHFTAAEVLDGDNMYRCPVNNKLVSTAKGC
jgi:hypothetical protein